MTTAGWHDLSFLGRLSLPVREAALRLGSPRVFQRDEQLIQQGASDKTAYLLLSGRVSVIKIVENGTAVLLGIRHAGDLVGEMALINGSERTATVTALDRCTASVIQASVFRRYLGEHPEVLLALGQMTGERLDQANTYRADAAGYAVESRLARALLYQARRLPIRDRGRFVVELRQRELAMLIGAQEGTIQKALNGPALRDLVLCRRGRVVLLDVPELAVLADMEPPAELG